MRPVSSPSSSAHSRTRRVIGIVEAAGWLCDTEFFITGWCHGPLAQGATVLVDFDGGSVSGRIWALRHRRPDVGAEAGFSAIVSLPSAAGAADFHRLLAEGQGELVPYGEMQRLSAGQCAALLRGALGSAPGPRPPPALVSAAMRFDGTDTVSVSSWPIRLGIDDCAAVGAGLRISGWLFDPEGLVERVDLAGADMVETIGPGWVRQPRADVAEAMGADPRFACYASPHQTFGFHALAMGFAGVREPRLTLVTAEALLHKPLSPRAGNPIALLKGLLRSIPPELPSSLDIVDRTVAPVLASLQNRRPGLVRVSGASGKAGADVSLVVGLSGNCEDAPAFLARLAVDPGLRELPIVLAADCGELDAWSGGIERAAGHYGLHLRLAYGRQIEDALDALTVGVEAAATRAVRLMLMDAPLDEAGSIPPTLRKARESASHPASRRPQDGPKGGVRAQAANLGRFCLSRADFMALGGFDGRFLDPQGKAEDFVERVHRAGVVSASFTETEPSCLPLAPLPAWRRLARRADQAAMRQRALAADAAEA